MCQEYIIVNFILEEAGVLRDPPPKKKKKNQEKLKTTVARRIAKILFRGKQWALSNNT